MEKEIFNKMLNDEICELRQKLNKSIEDGKEYSEILKLSEELDELIAKFISTISNDPKILEASETLETLENLKISEFIG
ncbi:MAG: aspartyl-phosphate phosphatase Spo0E family protein [Clostridia bacterium]|nr:aspartyl-phosphate phosphatase Spo0E family protein [Clostridia bacterium]